ncbi:phage filamentation protein Fil family protein [Cronobacter sakazakii]|uniref:phage filamentation protein Fil family protein n=1 Tax=Cronobacter sakazakii TaxID=28141 RepID=UPI0009408F64|nr:phage filamentation protein Fil family protein [Cronobacter sakazakii]ELY4345897.1 DUF2724 domain-containing protein [Cronobacter sakazakii]
MMNNEPSLASLLVKQSPAMHYGHGWIIGENGQRWHPVRSHTQAKPVSFKGAAWLSKLFLQRFR